MSRTPSRTGRASGCPSNRATTAYSTTWSLRFSIESLKLSPDATNGSSLTHHEPSSEIPISAVGPNEKPHPDRNTADATKAAFEVPLTIFPIMPMLRPRRDSNVREEGSKVKGTKPERPQSPQLISPSFPPKKPQSPLPQFQIVNPIIRSDPPGSHRWHLRMDPRGASGSAVPARPCGPTTPGGRGVPCWTRRRRR